MVPGPPRTSPVAVLLTVLAALGACAVFVGALGPTLLGDGWPIAAAGFVAVVIALVGLWRLYHRRDRSLW